jgi:hypothetical protein
MRAAALDAAARRVREWVKRRGGIAHTASVMELL